MWNGKLKAFTLSFDDGVTQDERMINLLNKYGLRGTFNLNSALLGTNGEKRSVFGDFLYSQDRISPERVKKLYANHEVAGHTLMHQNLTQLDDAVIIYQVEQDRKLLSELCGYEVVGFAYPAGGINHNEHVASVIKEKTGIKYARTNRCTRSFDFDRENLHLFNPTVPVYDYDEIIDFANKFIQLKTETPKLFYILGHTFELDEGSNINWEKFEKFCELISNKEDIFYGTNKQILLDN
ncbi:MAG: polysaccharide deacetylase [Clostridiales bacterium]|nr:polysaccharide deacetylase [Clostridiales bacterium]